MNPLNVALVVTFLLALGTGAAWTAGADRVSSWSGAFTIGGMVLIGMLVLSGEQSTLDLDLGRLGEALTAVAVLIFVLVAGFVGLSLLVIVGATAFDRFYERRDRRAALLTQKDAAK